MPRAREQSVARPFGDVDGRLRLSVGAGVAVVVGAAGTQQSPLVREGAHALDALVVPVVVVHFEAAQAPSARARR